MTSSLPLHIHLLGPMEVRRGTRRIELPASRKTRALLAYLVANEKTHRRDRLAELLWDDADDPRGGLRWCLTKIRPLVDGPRNRLIADRESVEFRADEADVDLRTVRHALLGGATAVPLPDLLKLSALFRGSFLEGLDLPDYDTFQAWLIACREDALQQRVSILRAILNRLSDNPSEAVGHARGLLEIDPLDESARSQLTAFLTSLGRHSEAKQVIETGRKLAGELGWAIPGISIEVDRTLPQPVSNPRANEQAPPPLEELVGRKAERQRLLAALDDSRKQNRGCLLLITGEPGVGKTRLLGEAVAHTLSLRGTVLSGRSYEAEARRPYGPWIDGIGSLHPSVVGEVLRNALAPLLTGLAHEDQQGKGKDQLFASIVELLVARAHSAPPVVLLFDDTQWCDAASAELLHYVVRMTRHRAVSVILTARSGELSDNDAMLPVLRSFRREFRMEEMELGALNLEETTQLARRFDPAADGAAVFEESAGNPLYTIEFARAASHSRDVTDVTLASLIEDRISRLPSPVEGVLRWAAVLGSSFSLNRLAQVASTGSDELMSALEMLDEHGLLRSIAGQQGQTPAMYTFAHGVVRRTVYDGLSEPRRRLMHGRVAQVLEKESHSPVAIAEIAHHSGLAGDTSTAARASAAAGRYCLQIYANSEALAFARSGMRFAETMPESERTGLQIELLEISLAARRPRETEKVAKRLEVLAERALAQGDAEHARLGFHLLSYLRWEGGDWSDAKRHSLRAEFVSRKADPREQIVAMAEAARCLAMLERDLTQAEALALEARARALNSGVETVAIPDALGMLRFHQGAWEEAAGFFHAARDLALQQGDRAGEFRALEHLVVLELERERPENAVTLCGLLVELAGKLRQGSEEPFARCLAALSAAASGKNVATDLAEALESLRMTDAKHRLAYALLRAASVDLNSGDQEKARSRGEEALRLAEILERPTETAMARVVLMRCALLRNAKKEAEHYAKTLRETNLGSIAAHVREAADGILRSSRDLLPPTDGPKRGI